MLFEKFGYFFEAIFFGIRLRKKSSFALRIFKIKIHFYIKPFYLFINLFINLAPPLCTDQRTPASKAGVLPLHYGGILLLMEVNLVFSNHPETRKEVLHFYDCSSRGYMLPILHAGDSMLQILIESVLNFTDNNGFLNLPI